MTNILIIDDNEVDTKVLEKLLDKESYNPIIAHSSDVGLNLARTKNIDLILLDIFMPGDNGFEVLQRLKQEPGLRDIPVFIFSIIEQESSRQKAFDLGADGYIPKPFNMREVVEQIKNIFPKSNSQSLL